MARPKADAFDVDTQERVLLAAEQIFAQKGYNRARLEDIAQEAGIRRPSLLYHFGSKGRLYTAVIERVMGDMEASVSLTTAQDIEFVDRLQLLIAAYTTFLDRRPSAAPLILRELIDGQGPGRDILLNSVDPMLLKIERFLRDVGPEKLPENFPVRQAILQIASGALVRKAAGPLRIPLWGEEDHTAHLVQRLFAR